jgi:hypothetical protein
MMASFDFEAKGEVGAPVGCSGDHPVRTLVRLLVEAANQSQIRLSLLMRHLFVKMSDLL